jgi:hypothetical protein
MEKLICEQNTREAEQKIIKAAKKEFPGKEIHTVFENGQWFVMVEDYKTYSVCDAEGYEIKAGFDFEII